MVKLSLFFSTLVFDVSLIPLLHILSLASFLNLLRDPHDWRNRDLFAELLRLEISCRYHVLGVRGSEGEKCIATGGLTSSCTPEVVHCTLGYPAGTCVSVHGTSSAGNQMQKVTGSDLRCGGLSLITGRAATIHSIGRIKSHRPLEPPSTLQVLRLQGVPGLDGVSGSLRIVHLPCVFLHAPHVDGAPGPSWSLRLSSAPFVSVRRMCLSKESDLRAGRGLFLALSAVDSGLAGCRTPESKRSSFERRLVSVEPPHFFFCVAQPPTDFSLRQCVPAGGVVLSRLVCRMRV
ncbi:hypothetical protein E2C01_024106 [Portunus trituberculatus]|uniref:Uncharacterized protein n=1 Tax=Portunus trituberculatus TaxID=210409 RepID=A0A5B7EBQ3_PORTR|nr:hypothetical protein [Portunus trituberculatus]